MSQITHFRGVKLLARKSGCVKFWTNIMSAKNGRVLLTDRARVKSHEVAQKCSQSGCQEVIKQSRWFTNTHKATSNWCQNDHQ